VYGGATGPDLWSWIATSMLFEGTQRGLFSLLFGAGLVLMTRSLERSSEPHAQDHFFRRNLWLIVFGVIHAYVLLWVGEILFYYDAARHRALPHRRHHGEGHDADVRDDDPARIWNRPDGQLVRSLAHTPQQFQRARA
jgi:hypothetical protein